MTDPANAYTPEPSWRGAEVHEQRVQRRDGDALMFRAVCTCGWRSPRRWATHSKADIEAQDHAELSHERAG